MTTRTHFARLLTREGVNKCIDMLTEAAGGPLGDLVEQDDDEAIIIRAPDGDVVFQALAKDRDSWLCRLHREVFDEAVTLPEAGTTIRLEGAIGGWQ